MTTSLLAQLEAAAAQTDWAPARPSDAKRKRPDNACKFAKTLASLRGALRDSGWLSQAELQARTGLVRPTVLKGLRHFMERGEVIVSAGRNNAKLYKWKGE